MKDLRTAASFQYISLNNDNGQFYINIDESVPVDELIRQRGDGLNDSQLDSYYFDVLKQATEVSETAAYVFGYKIWLHEIPWMDRRVKREGYLFFGAPNERSTAQPERDFYIYMLQAFEEPDFKDEQKEDEVFFRLKKKMIHSYNCCAYMGVQQRCTMIRLLIKNYISLNWKTIKRS